MTFQIHLLRLGRIHKPKYDIILYHNFRTVARLGCVYPLENTTIANKPLKIVSLNVEKTLFWVQRGVVLPIWLRSIYDTLYNPSVFYPGKIYPSRLLHQNLVSGRTIFQGKSFTSYSKNLNFSSPKFKFFRGKYILRHWIRSKFILQQTKK